MTEPTPTDELREAERRLQAAQLTGDTAALEQLLDDRGTFGPDGDLDGAGDLACTGPDQSGEPPDQGQPAAPRRLERLAALEGGQVGDRRSVHGAILLG